MPQETFELIVNRIKRENINPQVFDLFAVGEPLLDKRLFERIRALKAQFLAAKVRINTNFSLADDKIIDELLTCGLDSVHISVNASEPQTYKQIMGLDYERTIGNIRRLLERRAAKGARLNVLLSFVICDENRSQYKTFMRDWDKQVDSIRMQRASPWAGMMPRLSPGGHLLGKAFACKQLFERIVILSDGRFALCCQDSVGLDDINVRDTPILQAFYSQLFQTARAVHLARKVETMHSCRDCMAIHANGLNWLLKEPA